MQLCWRIVHSGCVWLAILVSYAAECLLRVPFVPLYGYGGDKFGHHALSRYPFCNSPHKMLTPSALKPFLYQRPRPVITGGSRSKTARESTVRTVDTLYRHRRKFAKNWRTISGLTWSLRRMDWIWIIVEDKCIPVASNGSFVGLML